MMEEFYKDLLTYKLGMIKEQQYKVEKIEEAKKAGALPSGNQFHMRQVASESINPLESIEEE